MTCFFIIIFLICFVLIISKKFFVNLFIYLFHTSIWHQPEVDPCEKIIKTIKKLNEKKILKSNSKIKNLFSKQKQRDVMTSFRHFNKNKSCNPWSHKKKQKNKIKKIKSNSSMLNFHSSSFRFCETILNKIYINLCIL